MLFKKNIIILFIVNFSYSIAQNNFCGMSQNNPQYAALRAQFNQKEIQLNNLAYQYLQQHVGNVMNGSTVEIPIVFHIIHQNGPENIADSVVITEVMRLNQRFSNTGMFNYADGVNVNIQFCLASIDPYGNPTTGITRTVSPLTNMPLGGDAAVKNLSRWNPYRYINVWLVNNCVIAMGAGAYAYFPWDAFGMHDGIVITASSMGAAFPYFLLSHEVGHYFGLYHNNEGDSCLNDNCLLDGDRVCDTPPEFEPAFCNGNTCNSDMDDTSGFNPFTMDMNDISNVMMPIIGCPYLFTQGQADRMNFFLNNIRYKLLNSNGCGQHPSSNPLPIALIGNITNTCNGYIFTSNATNAEYIEWDFNGDGLTDAIGDTVTYLFPAQGNYTIVLRAFNEVGYDADTLNFQSLSQNNTIFPLSTYTGVSNNGGFACMGSNLTLTAVPGMAHYNWSTGDTTQTIVIPVTAPVNVTLTCIDSLGMIWQKCPDPVFTWGVAPSPAPFSLTLLSDDTLCTNQIFQAEIPTQPGTFRQIFSDGYPWIVNNNQLNLAYLQQNSYYISVVLRNLTNYCPTYADTIYILFTDPVDSLQTPVVYGNYIAVGDTVPQVQWYLDGVAIPWANSDTLFMNAIGCYTYEAWNLDRDCSVMSSEYCQTVTSSLQAENKNDFIVYPNPNDGNFTIISYSKNINSATVLITDITGRNVPFELILLNDKTIQIDIESLAFGVYNLHFNGENQKLIRSKN
jgi:hypothetical protein